MNEYNEFMQYNQNVFLQDTYLKLINHREAVMFDEEHKKDVLKGYFKILGVLERLNK